jgi:hypothetical protein
MATKTPTYGQIKQAFIDHGVNFKEVKGCTTIGRPWDSNNPLVGHVHHHTSTPSATDSNPNPAPTLEWLMTAFSKPAANCLVGRDGVVYICSWGSCFHSGLGGPWKSRGLSGGNTGHYRLWGTEIDDPGNGKTINAKQIEAVGRMDAAFMKLCGWDEYALINHADWTDAGQWLKNPQGQADGPAGRYEGRKNDTLRQYYPASFWRTNAKKYVVGPTPPAPTPTPLKKVWLVSVQPGKRNQQVWTVQNALKQEGLYSGTPTGYFDAATKAAYAKWQNRLGYTGTDANGVPGIQSLTNLGEKYKFVVATA